MTVNIQGLKKDISNISKVSWTNFKGAYDKPMYRLNMWNKYNDCTTLWFDSYWRSKYYYYLIKFLKVWNTIM
ncbi:MAG: hypothetical protein IJ715_02215 [Bacilli bacterium]|nr:hypothetical protein [Bacilli bacterium]